MKSEMLMFALSMVAVLAVILILSRFAFGLQARFIYGFSFTEEAVEKDNPAVLIRLAGLMFATLVAFTSIVAPTGLGPLYDFAKIGQCALVSIGAIFVSLWVNDKFILREFPNTEEVVANRNVAVAIVEACTMIATALIFSGAFGGSDDLWFIELGWFVCGQLLFVVLSQLYRLVINKAGQHILEQNSAVALSMGGFLLASGLALSRAVSGEFKDVWSDLGDVGLYMLLWLVVMAAIHLLMNYVIIPGGRIRKEMVNDRNWGVGLADGAISVAMTVALVSMFK